MHVNFYLFSFFIFRNHGLSRDSILTLIRNNLPSDSMKFIDTDKYPFGSREYGFLERYWAAFEDMAQFELAYANDITTLYSDAVEARANSKAIYETIPAAFLSKNRAHN